MHRDVARALVGHREVADLLHLVAEEVDPDRMLLGRWEDVHDAAADRELAAPLDQIHPDVRGTDQIRRELGPGRSPAPATSRTGVRSARPFTCGWSTLRTGATMIRGAGSSALPASRRRTASRRPTVSERGLSRSCGSVSQAG